MSRKKIILLVTLIVAPVIIYLLWPTDESRIRKLFKEGAKAIEKEKIDDIIAKVSFNYTDEYGMTYLYIRAGILRAFQRLEQIKVEYEITRIEIKDNTASAELDIRVIASAGSDTGYIIGDAAKPLHMKFSLEKERFTWLVAKSEGIRFDF
jgi:hypothetical protein